MEDKGFVALVTILIISAVALLIGVSVSLISVGEAKMSLEENQASQAYYLVNLCAEMALMKLKENINYLGDEVINIGDESCYILPIEGNWIVRASAIFSDRFKRIKIVISQVNPEIIIASWQEAPDF